jgi:hypothetical protein
MRVWGLEKAEKSKDKCLRKVKNQKGTKKNDPPPVCPV